MRLLLMRHGATEWNLEGRCQGASDTDLSEIGIEQAKEAAGRLGREPIAAVYSSDLKRALQTASFIGQRHGLEVIVEPDLRELDHGELEGLTFEQIRAAYPDFMRQWRSEPAAAAIPGGERLLDVERRAWDGLHRIAARHRLEDTVVVVSHQFPIAALLCRITGTPLNLYRTFHIDPCGLSHLNFHPATGFEVVQVNGRVAPRANKP